MNAGLGALLVLAGTLGTAPWWWSRPPTGRTGSARPARGTRGSATGGPGALSPRRRAGRTSPAEPLGRAAAPFTRTATPLATAGRGRRPTGGSATVSPALLLELVDAAVSTGAALPRALGAVAVALPGEQGDALARVASSLELGATWDIAWASAPGLLDTRRALAVAWETGAAPGPALGAAADRLRRESRSQAREAAARLGVHLVLPLGVCFLPAFVLLGLAPVVLSFAGALLG